MNACRIEGALIGDVLSLERIPDSVAAYIRYGTYGTNCHSAGWQTAPGNASLLQNLAAVMPLQGRGVEVPYLPASSYTSTQVTTSQHPGATSETPEPYSHLLFMQGWKLMMEDKMAALSSFFGSGALFPCVMRCQGSLLYLGRRHTA